MTPTGWTCPRRIGFLFPHPCDRLTPEGCPDCQNGQLNDPYRHHSGRGDYDDYDDYDDATYAAAGASGAAVADFTEGDGENLVKPVDEFEDDLTES